MFENLPKEQQDLHRAKMELDSIKKQQEIQKEQQEPAIKALCREIERVTGEHVWSGDTLGGLELKTIQILNQALSVIKTELTAVAS
jgi:hypothetical protein